jgi:hypothetical protein
VVSTPLDWRERTGCFAAVARYVLRGERWLNVLKEPW